MTTAEAYRNFRQAALEFSRAARALKEALSDCVELPYMEEILGEVFSDELRAKLEDKRNELQAELEQLENRLAEIRTKKQKLEGILREIGQSADEQVAVKAEYVTAASDADVVEARATEPEQAALSEAVEEKTEEATVEHPGARRWKIKESREEFFRL